jgi:hypothetical protein
MRTNYSPREQLYNNGFLALVSPKYVTLAHKVVDLIATILTESMIASLGNSCMEEARANIQEAIA